MLKEMRSQRLIRGFKQSVIKRCCFFSLSIISRSQEKKEEAITLLKDSIKYGPEFADAYSSLASLLAEQVTVSFELHIFLKIFPVECIH